MLECSVGMDWWSKLPSLTPIKGTSRFLYVWTHWDTISEDLKKRDERRQEIEDWARQRLRLQEESFEAERRKRELEQELEREKLRAFADRAVPALERITAHIDTLHRTREEIFDALIETANSLAILLHLENDAGLREQVLTTLSPKAREVVSHLLDSIRQRLGGGGGSPAQLP